MRPLQALFISHPRRNRRGWDVKQMKGSGADPGLVLVCRPLGDYFIIADSICDLMQLLEISKDSIESVPVTHGNRLINHSPSAPWHL